MSVYSKNHSYSILLLLQLALAGAITQCMHPPMIPEGQFVTTTTGTQFYLGTEGQLIPLAQQAIYTHQLPAGEQTITHPQTGVQYYFDIRNNCLVPVVQPPPVQPLLVQYSSLQTYLQVLLASYKNR
jgi:hypothetical protein